MTETDIDSSSVVRNVLWTRVGLTQWLEVYLRREKNRNSITHLSIRMSVVLRAVKMEMHRIRFCAACGDKKHQSTQGELEWPKIWTWCDGEIDPRRCRDCGRSRDDVRNLRCAECLKIWRALKRIVEEVAKSLGVIVTVPSNARDPFGAARRARAPKEMRERTPLVPRAVDAGDPNDVPEWGSHAARVMGPGARAEMPEGEVHHTGRKIRTKSINEILEDFGKTIALCRSEKGTGAKRRLFIRAWEVITKEKKSFPVYSSHDRFIRSMCEIWYRWDLHKRRLGNHNLRSIMKAVDMCSEGRTDRNSLIETVDTAMNG